MSKIDLAGKTALVTGAGTRVGAAIARALADAGCDLVIHFGHNADGAAATDAHAKSLGRRTLVVSADLRKREDIARLAAETKGFGGELAVLVNSAANFERVDRDHLDAQSWDAAMSLNATAPYLLTVSLRDELAKARGAMIAVGDIAADRPWKSYLAYSVSKSTLVHLVRAFAITLAPEIRANAVSPGTVMLPKDYDEQTADRIRSRIPLERIGAAEDIARAVVFLAENDFITGQVLAVDGGRSLADAL